MADIELLVEAERRGLLPPEQTALLAEARSRGIVPPAGGAVGTTETAGATPTSPPGILERAGTTAMDVVKGVGQGVVNTLKAPVNLATGVYGAVTEGIPADIAAIRQNPAEALTRIGRETVQNITSGLPATVGAVLGGAAGNPAAGAYIGQTLQDLTTSILNRDPMPVQESIARSVEAAGSVLLPDWAVRSTKAAAKFAVRELPGAAVGLHEIAIPRAEALPAEIRPTSGAVNAAYAKLDAMGNPKVSMGPLRKTALEILTAEEIATKPNTDIIAQARRILDSSAEGWDWRYAQDETRRLGEQIGNIQKNKGERLTETKRLYAGIRESMDQGKVIVVEAPAERGYAASQERDPSTGRPLIPARAAVPAQVSVNPATAETIAKSLAWKEAQWTARRNFAADELADMVNRSITPVGESHPSLNVNKIIKEIDQAQRASNLSTPDKDAKRFVGSFTPGELEGIKSSLREIGANLPKIPAIPGTPVGSSQRFLHYALGGAIGGTTGGMVAIISAEMISQALMTSPGREFVKSAMRIYPTVSPEFVQVMGAFLRTNIAKADTATTQKAIRVLSDADLGLSQNTRAKP